MQRSDTRRSRKMGDQIMRALASLLASGTGDPRLESVTISGVRMNSDLSVAEVLYSVHGQEEERKQAQAALDKAAGFLRTRLGRALKMKRLPALRFSHDDFLEDMVYAPRPQGD